MRRSTAWLPPSWRFWKQADTRDKFDRGKLLLDGHSHCIPLLRPEPYFRNQRGTVFRQQRCPVVLLTGGTDKFSLPSEMLREIAR